MAGPALTSATRAALVGFAFALMAAPAPAQTQSVTGAWRTPLSAMLFGANLEVQPIAGAPDRLRMSFEFGRGTSFASECRKLAQPQNALANALCDRLLKDGRLSGTVDLSRDSSGVYTGIERTTKGTFGFWPAPAGNNYLQLGMKRSDGTNEQYQSPALVRTDFAANAANYAGDWAGTAHGLRVEMRAQAQGADRLRGSLAFFTDGPLETQTPDPIARFHDIARKQRPFAIGLPGATVARGTTARFQGRAASEPGDHEINVDANVTLRLVSRDTLEASFAHTGWGSERARNVYVMLHRAEGPLQAVPAAPPPPPAALPPPKVDPSLSRNPATASRDQGTSEGLWRGRLFAMPELRDYTHLSKLTTVDADYEIGVSETAEGITFTETRPGARNIGKSLYRPQKRSFDDSFDTLMKRHRAQVPELSQHLKLPFPNGELARDWIGGDALLSAPAANAYVLAYRSTDGKRLLVVTDRYDHREFLLLESSALTRPALPATQGRPAKTGTIRP